MLPASKRTLCPAKTRYTKRLYALLPVFAALALTAASSAQADIEGLQDAYTTIMRTQERMEGISAVISKKEAEIAERNRQIATEQATLSKNESLTVSKTWWQRTLIAVGFKSPSEFDIENARALSESKTKIQKLSAENDASQRIIRSKRTEHEQVSKQLRNHAKAFVHEMLHGGSVFSGVRVNSSGASASSEFIERVNRFSKVVRDRGKPEQFKTILMVNAIPGADGRRVSETKLSTWKERNQWWIEGLGADTGSPILDAKRKELLASARAHSEALDSLVPNIDRAFGREWVKLKVQYRSHKRQYRLIAAKFPPFVQMEVGLRPSWIYITQRPKGSVREFTNLLDPDHATRKPVAGRPTLVTENESEAVLAKRATANRNAFREWQARQKARETEEAQARPEVLPKAVPPAKVAKSLEGEFQPQQPVKTKSGVEKTRLRSHAVSDRDGRVPTSKGFEAQAEYANNLEKDRKLLERRKQQNEKFVDEFVKALKEKRALRAKKL